MQKLRNFLVSKHFISNKESRFYLLRAKNLYAFIGKHPGARLKKQDID